MVRFYIIVNNNVLVEISENFYLALIAVLIQYMSYRYFKKRQLNRKNRREAERLNKRFERNFRILKIASISVSTVISILSVVQFRSVAKSYQDEIANFNLEDPKIFQIIDFDGQIIENSMIDSRELVNCANKAFLPKEFFVSLTNREFGIIL